MKGLAGTTARLGALPWPPEPPRPTALRPLVFSDPKRLGTRRRDGRVAQWEVIQRALGAEA